VLASMAGCGACREEASADALDALYTALGTHVSRQAFEVRVQDRKDLAAGQGAGFLARVTRVVALKQLPWAVSQADGAITVTVPVAKATVCYEYITLGWYEPAVPMVQVAETPLLRCFFLPSKRLVLALLQTCPGTEAAFWDHFPETASSPELKDHGLPGEPATLVVPSSPELKDHGLPGASGNPGEPATLVVPASAWLQEPFAARFSLATTVTFQAGWVEPQVRLNSRWVPRLAVGLSLATYRALVDYFMPRIWALTNSPSWEALRMNACGWSV